MILKNDENGLQKLRFGLSSIRERILFRYFVEKSLKGGTNNDEAVFINPTKVFGYNPDEIGDVELVIGNKKYNVEIKTLNIPSTFRYPSQSHNPNPTVMLEVQKAEKLLKNAKGNGVLYVTFFCDYFVSILGISSELLKSLPVSNYMNNKKTMSDRSKIAKNSFIIDTTLGKTTKLNPMELSKQRAKILNTLKDVCIKENVRIEIPESVIEDTIDEIFKLY